MKKDYFYAVLNVQRTAYNEVRKLADCVIKGFTGSTIYTEPEPALSILIAARNLLVTCINKATGAKATTASRKLRNEQSGVLYDLLYIGCLYVNLTAKGDRAKIQASGYPVGKTPERHGQPADVVINRVVSGKPAHSCRIYLQRGTLGKRHHYDVQIIPFSGQVPAAPWNPDTLPWATVLHNVRSSKLLITGLPPGTQILVRLRATDNDLLGKWTFPVPFIVQ